MTQGRVHVEREAFDGIVDGLKFHGWPLHRSEGSALTNFAYPLYGIGQTDFFPLPNNRAGGE